jgi:hypothetical protein
MGLWGSSARQGRAEPGQAQGQPTASCSHRPVGRSEGDCRGCQAGERSQGQLAMDALRQQIDEMVLRVRQVMKQARADLSRRDARGRQDRQRVRARRKWRGAAVVRTLLPTGVAEVLSLAFPVPAAVGSGGDGQTSWRRARMPMRICCRVRRCSWRQLAGATSRLCACACSAKGAHRAPATRADRQHRQHRQL